MRSLRAAMAATLLAMSPGCGMQGGAGWDADVPKPPDPPVVSLVLIGDAGHPGRFAKRVAPQLDSVLEREHAEGRHPILIWLGANVLPRGPSPKGEGPDCTAPADVWRRRGIAALEKAARKHIDRDGDSYAVLGGDDWACEFPHLEIQHNYADGGNPWLMPDFHYVVRVGRDGSSKVVSDCRPTGPCQIEPVEGAQPPLFDLVMLDTSPWVSPPAGWTPEHEVARASLDQQEALLEALQTSDGPTPPPRILAMHVPVESAGYHGLGGGDPTATFAALPPAVAKAVQAGMFVGVLSAHDRNLQVEPDMTRAVKRSAQVWLDAPTFQVVSGAASRPDGAGERTRLFWRGIALAPSLWSTHPGFVVLRISPDRVDAIVHRKASAWRTGTASFPLQRDPHPEEQPAAANTPCRDCSDVPPGETRR